MTAKEIAQKRKVKEIDPWEDQSAKWAVGKYVFTPDELQAYADALCKEQREKCFRYADGSVKELGGLNQHMRHKILTAPQPEES